MKSFLQMIKFEIVRIIRNKMILLMLLLFSIVILLMVAFAQNGRQNFKIAVLNMPSNAGEIEILKDTVSKTADSKFVEVSSIEEGKMLVKKMRVGVFIAFEQSGENVTADVYYNATDAASRGIKSRIEKESTKFVAETLSEWLSGWASLDADAIMPVEVKRVSVQEVNTMQSAYVLEVAACISVVLMFGLAFSIARDNETNVSANLKYIPLNIHKYLWSKIIPYLILGIIEIAIILPIGALLFDIKFQLNIVLVGLLTVPFILAVVMMGMLFSTLKSQLTTVFVDVAIILLPVFLLGTSFIQSLPIILQGVLYALPISTYLYLGNAMIFDGIVLLPELILLCAQAVFYYFATIIILKHRTGR